MALSPPGVVDVVAVRASPVVRTGHVRPGGSCRTPSLLGVLAPLALVPEVKVQVGALGAVPLPVHLLLPPTVLSGARARPLPPPHHVLIGLLLCEQHRRLEHGQLGLDQGPYPLDHIHLWRCWRP